MQISYEGAAQFLLNNDKYLIVTHKSPDGDTLGSAIALCRALQCAGKQAYIMENAGATARYQPFLEGLIAKNDYSPEHIIAVDIADTMLLPKASQVYAEKISLSLDHHVSHREYAKQYLVDAGAAACGEIIWDVICKMGIEPNRAIAEAIYIAISTDTSCFLNSNTTARTHQTAAALYPYKIDFIGLNRIFFVIKTRARLTIESKLISNMSFYQEGKIAVMQITNDLVSETGVNEDDLDNISALARSVEGVELGILVRERSGPKSKISMRSSELVDVSKICERFGGGGHVRAAGCLIELAPQDAEKLIINTILNENLL